MLLCVKIWPLVTIVFRKAEFDCPAVRRVHSDLAYGSTPTQTTRMMAVE
jgi:hypothetical protein